MQGISAFLAKCLMPRPLTSKALAELQRVWCGQGSGSMLLGLWGSAGSLGLKLC